MYNAVKCVTFCTNGVMGHVIAKDQVRVLQVIRKKKKYIYIYTVEAAYYNRG